MRCGNEGAGVGLSCLQGNDALSLLKRLLRQLGKSNRLADGFDKHANGGDTLVVHECFEHVFHTAACLVAYGDHV